MRRIQNLVLAATVAVSIGGCSGGEGDRTKHGKFDQASFKAKALRDGPRRIVWREAGTPRPVDAKSLGKPAAQRRGMSGAQEAKGDGNRLGIREAEGN